MARETELTEQQIATFWKNVKRRADHRCWPWIGYKDAEGYGHRCHDVVGIFGRIESLTRFRRARYLMGVWSAMLAITQRAATRFIFA